MKISYIVPVFNGEKYIKKCVDSIESANNSDDFEIIIVNDGSTDNTSRIIEEISNVYRNIKNYFIANSGVSSARNFGISKANGDFVSFVDCDDEIQHVNIPFEDNADLYSFGMASENSSIKKCIPFNDSGIINNFIKYPVYMNSVCNKFFRRSIIEENNICFDAELFTSEDMKFVLDFLLTGANIEYINQTYYVYRMNDNSVTHKRIDIRTIANFHLAYEKVLRSCEAVGAEVRYKKLLTYLRLKSSILYLIDLDTFSAQTFRENTHHSDIWIYSKNVFLTFITLAAQLHVDFIPYIYAVCRSKKLAHNKG